MLKLPSASLLSIAVLAVSSTVFASPTRRDDEACHPNFGGRAVSIVASSGAMEWGKGTLQVERALAYQTIRNGHGEFKVEFTGYGDDTYWIKSADDSTSSLYVSQGPRSNILAWAAGPGPRWEITCSDCSSEDASSFPGGEFASDCSITRSGSGLCVRESTEGLGAFIRQYSCEGGDEEKFSFLIQQ